MFLKDALQAKHVFMDKPPVSSILAASDATRIVDFGRSRSWLNFIKGGCERLELGSDAYT